MIRVSINVNGREHHFAAPPMKRLVDVLREKLQLSGTKEGCGEGECGACTVIMDGLLVLSCIVPICHAQGKKITTIEGLMSDEGLHPVQRAFYENGGVQCGICTPGMIVASNFYIEHPEEAEDVQEALAGNQCRCTGYTRVFESIKAVKDV